MTREEAFNLLKNKIKNPNMLKHSLAVELCLRDLADYFHEDREMWGLAGLLHDYDYEEMLPFPEKHGLVGADELEKMGLDKEAAQAIRAHNEKNGTPRTTNLEKAIYSVDPMTGLIVAAVLVLPSKKISDLNVDSILNRYGEKRFASGANREIIGSCVNLNMTLRQFTEVCLKAMQEISADLGL